MNISRCLLFIALSLLLAPAFCLGQDSGFDGLDTDSDGKVSKKEFQEYAKGRLPDFDQADKFADRVDADKDGTISEDEFDGRMEVLQALNQEMLNGGDKTEKKEKTKEELKMIDEATKAYEAMTKLVSKGDWEQAAKGMTKQGSDDYAIGIVTQSLTLIKMKLPPQMDIPAVNDVKDATIDLIEEYKLSDIDISFFLKNRGSQGRSNSDDDDSDDTDMTPQEKAKAKQEKVKAKQVELKAEIVAAIDKNDQRWEIVAALRDAQKGSPLQRDIFNGKVSDSDVDDSAVFLTVTQNTPGIVKVAIPVVVKMTAEKGNWRYSGLDSPRTQKAIQKMVQRLRGGGNRAPAEPDTDF